MYEEIRAQLCACVKYLKENASLRDGAVVVLGCSTSEVAGGHIGKNSVPELGDALASAMLEACAQYGLRPAFQCCEHLNRALVMEQSLLSELRLTQVNVMPVPKAGGSTGAAAYRLMRQPAMAQSLGYTNRGGMRAVERFMKHYFLVAKDVGDLTRIFCAALEEEQAKEVPGFNRLFPTFSRRSSVVAEASIWIVRATRFANASIRQVSSRSHRESDQINQASNVLQNRIESRYCATSRSPLPSSVQGYSSPIAGSGSGRLTPTSIAHCATRASRCLRIPSCSAAYARRTFSDRAASLSPARTTSTGCS